MSEIEKVSEGSGTQDVDGSEMKLFEKPVDLPEKVLVVDGKLGKEIGFVERERVMELLASDPRYEGFEDGCTGKFMLAYNSDGAKTKVISLETEEMLKFLDTVEANLDTAIDADDIIKMRLGVSYERKGRAYHMSIHFRTFKAAVRWLHPDVVLALGGTGEDSDETESGGPTGRLIEWMKKAAGKTA